jgi:hypothetical protein
MRATRPEIPADASVLAGELLAEGLLTRSAAGCGALHPPEVVQPRELLSGARDTMSALDAARLLPWFLKACAVADYSLRRSALGHICSRIKRRKAMAARTVSHARLEKLTGVFQVLRPFYPRPYLCLFDSLALLEFLAYWTLFPAWVFGVSVDPFEAHCWVQQDTLVLCDTVSFSSRWFVPIMAL